MSESKIDRQADIIMPKVPIMKDVTVRERERVGENLARVQPGVHEMLLINIPRGN